MQVKEIYIDTGKIKEYEICKIKYNILFSGGPTTPTYSNLALQNWLWAQRGRSQKIQSIRQDGPRSKRRFKECLLILFLLHLAILIWLEFHIFCIIYVFWNWLHFSLMYQNRFVLFTLDMYTKLKIPCSYVYFCIYITYVPKT